MTYSSSLQLHDVTLMVQLGYGEEERATPQEIRLHITLFLSNPPLATEQDGAGFFCYHALCDALEACTQGRSFQLIEYLATHYATTLQTWLDSTKQRAGVEDIRYRLTLHKPYVPVAAMRGGASYSVSTFERSDISG